MSPKANDAFPAKSAAPAQHTLDGRAAIWTIGYEGRTVEELVATLHGAGVRQLVDVRELPISRKKGFSKSALAAAVEAAGIRYTGMRQLGAPREARHRVREDGEWAPFATAYLAHLDGQGAALADLARLARSEPTAMLCFERSAADCHRGLLAQRLGKEHALATIDL